VNLREGQTLTMKRGTKMRIGPLLGAGGEGCVHKATDQRDGTQGVAKAFTNSSPERVKRTQFLVELELPKLCRILHGPTDWQVNGGVIHFSPYAEGVSLEEHLESGGNLYTENCKIAIATSHACAILDQHQISHGDYQLKNLNVKRTAFGLDVAMFDFDNFIAPGVPPPLSIGQEHMMAPELRSAYKAGRPIAPDLYSDRYAYTVLMHELLLAKHVASGFDDDPDQFDACMLSGRWWHDPASGKIEKTKGGGYPSFILDVDLARLFRRGLSSNREDRPTPQEWRETLSRSFEQIYVHPRCGGPVFADSGKSRCPFCGESYRLLKLVFPSLSREFICDGTGFSLGRQLLSSPNVSALHANVHRIGPIVRIESFGRNGSYRYADGGWVAFQHAIIEAGDRLRVADVEARVEEAPA